MKQTAKFLFALSFVVSLTACEKEVIAPQNECVDTGRIQTLLKMDDSSLLHLAGTPSGEYKDGNDTYYVYKNIGHCYLFIHRESGRYDVGNGDEVITTSGPTDAAIKIRQWLQDCKCGL